VPQFPSPFGGGQGVGLNELQVCTHRDAVADALVHRTPGRVMRVRPLGSLALVGRAAGQGVVDVNALDNEHLVLDLDLTFGG
jgi:hypothetical protein